LVAAGRAGTSTNSPTAVARFTTGGLPDPDFGTGGKVELELTHAVNVSGVSALPGGAIALAGMTYAADAEFAVTRLRANGTVDDVAHRAVGSAEGNDTLTAATRTASGALVVAGSLYRA